MFIHTIEYRCDVANWADRMVFGHEKWKPLFYQKEKDIYQKVTDCCVYRYNKRFHKLQTIINPNKLLGREVTSNDLDEFKARFLEHFRLTFQYTNPLEMLTQVHYCEDILIEPKETYDLYFELITKGSDAGDVRRKITKYSTSVYLHSKYVQINIYNKHEESKQANQYKGVLRFEIQIMRGHIWEMLKKHGIEDVLENYWSDESRNRYMNEYLRSIIFSGDYYTIDRARTILKNRYSEGSRYYSELSTFLANISKYGANKVKNTSRKYAECLKTRIAITS